MGPPAPLVPLVLLAAVLPALDAALWVLLVEEAPPPVSPPEVEPLEEGEEQAASARTSGNASATSPRLREGDARQKRCRSEGAFIFCTLVRGPILRSFSPVRAPW